MHKGLYSLLIFLWINESLAQEIWKFHDKKYSFILQRDSTLSDDSSQYNCTIKSIGIFELSSGKQLQNILIDDNSLACNMPPDEVFITEDINFDGWNDFRLLQFMPAAPNLPYYFWIFNSKKGSFERDTTLENITSPSFDSKLKIIQSAWRDGCCTHGTDTYSYINGKIVLIEQIVSEIDPDTNKETISKRKRINGKMTDLK